MRARYVEGENLLNYNIIPFPIFFQLRKRREEEIENKEAKLFLSLKS
jgi:hypothetical protein